MHYLIDLAEIQSSGRSDKARLQYFNQSLRTRANLGRSLTFKIGFQTGLEIVNGETYLTVVRGTVYPPPCVILRHVSASPFTQPPYIWKVTFCLPSLVPQLHMFLLCVCAFFLFQLMQMSISNKTALVALVVYTLPSRKGTVI